MKFSTVYSELLLELNSRSPRRNTDFIVWTSSLTRTVRELKDTVVCFLENYCEGGLITMKLQLLNYLYDNLEKLSGINFLDSAPYEHFNLVVKSI